MQVRGAVAVAMAAWLVLAGLLALRHEAEVAHVTDAHGALVHGAHAIGHRAARADHLHAGAPVDHGECALAAALRQPGTCVSPPALVAAPARAIAIAAAPARVLARTATLFRLAPKTSPPRA
jgi:hypothetical protein